MKPKKNLVIALPISDNVLRENYSRPRLGIMVTKASPKKLPRLKLGIFLPLPKNFLQKNTLQVLSLVFLSKMQNVVELSTLISKTLYFKIFSLSLPFL